MTRLTANAVSTTAVGTREVVQRGRIVRDTLIALTGSGAPAKRPYPLRRVEEEDPETGDPVVFLTNQLECGATTIARISQDRRSASGGFKALRQSLKITPFVGTSTNALHTQRWTALIAMLRRN